MPNQNNFISFSRKCQHGELLGRRIKDCRNRTNFLRYNTISQPSRIEPSDCHNTLKDFKLTIYQKVR